MIVLLHHFFKQINELHYNPLSGQMKDHNHLRLLSFPHYSYIPLILTQLCTFSFYLSAQHMTVSFTVHKPTAKVVVSMPSFSLLWPIFHSAIHVIIAISNSDLVLPYFPCFLNACKIKPKSLSIFHEFFTTLPNLPFRLFISNIKLLIFLRTHHKLSSI